MSRLRVFMAMSLDGFIAGPNHELDWLGGRDGIEDTFTPFFAQIGAMLMCRQTYDVVNGGEWPYGDTPVLVASTRAFEPTQPSVRIQKGDIGALVSAARDLAGGRDIYLDGGQLIRQALDAGLVDELTITLIPIVLGEGIPLFSGARRRALNLLSQRPVGAGLVELRYALNRSAAPT